MSHAPIARWTVAALVLCCVPAAAEPLTLDLDAALARAHRFAPAAIAARGAVAAADARVIAAEVAFVDNPELEVGAGPRLAPDGGRGSIDVEARIGQPLELGRRGPRRQVAGAERAHAQAEGQVAGRALDREVASAFVAALFAERSAELARHAEDIAERGARVAERRRTAGDVTDLDANLARAALGRARAGVQAAAAERASAIGKLASLVGARAEDEVVLRGELATLGAPSTGAPTPGAPATLAARADVRVLDAERAVAIAERADAGARAWPALGLWASYRREDTTDIVLGGVQLTLPLWNRAHGEIAAARARERSAGEARDATLIAAARQVADARAAYDSAREAIAVFERDVVPLLDDSEQLLQRTVDAGQIAIHDYLVARQELLDGRREYLERARAVAQAAIELRDASGGGL